MCEAMNTFEKLYSIFAIIFAMGLIVILFLYPDLRQFKVLIPLSLFGIIINIGLMFIVLRDIFYRQFSNPTSRYIWIAIILFFWPAVLYYLPKHGFKPRNQ